MKHNLFNKTRLATSLSLVLGATAFASTSAVAAEEEVEVIEVTGIRGSLIRAMDVKRDSAGVVDAISAEDMGKFPDTNLAESLQRITGVSIDRNNGEGSKVTVRGFGPDYNLVTLNGRQMPSSSINATSASDSRSFDFGNLASEGVSGVEVYKTGKASIATGGIGSTINLTTVKPLSNPGLNATFGVKGVYDKSSEEGGMTPEFSGLYSNTFFDDKVGIAVSASYQLRNSGEARAHTENSHRPVNNATGGWGALPAPVTSGDEPHINRPTGNTTYIVPQNLVYGFNQTQRERTNGQLTLQYRPIEALTATLDYTYSENEVEVDQNIASVWMNFGTVASEWRDVNSNNVTSPVWVTENNVGIVNDNGNPTYGPGDLGYADLVSQVEQSASVSKNESVGINLEYQVNDNLVLKLDVHSSSAESKPDSIYGNSNTIQMAANVRAQTTLDFSSEFPVARVVFPSQLTEEQVQSYANDDWPNPVNSLANINSFDPSLIRTTGTSFRNSYMKSEIDQVQLDGTYSFDDGIVSSVDFGIGQTTVDNRNAFAIAERATWGGVGQFDDIPDGVFYESRSTLIDRFDNMPGDKSGMWNEFYAVDFETMANIVGTKYGQFGDEQTWPCGTQICAPSKYTTDRRTEEDSTFAYVQANLVFDIADMPLNVLAGLRYEATDVNSNTLLPDILSISWISDNEFNIERGNDVFYSGTGDYDYVLPSLDISFEPIEDLLVRASFSKTLTRPGYGNLTAGGTIGSVNVQKATGSRGNPSLLPIESTNFDLSLEYYYGEASYVSLGYFKKDVENFIGNNIVNETFEGLYSPVQGPRFDNAYQAASDAAGVGTDPQNGAIRTEIISQAGGYDGQYLVAPNATTGEGAKIFGEPGQNSEIVVEFSQPVNQDDNSADGLEVAAQHMFGESGFGAIVNFTVVDSDLELDDWNVAPGGQSPLFGLSDSANLVAFYDKDGLQARFAYNWRDAFLAYTTAEGGVYTDSYGQWDANISYEVSQLEGLTLFVEAINLTDETTRQYTRDERMTFRIAQTGTRYNFGARYTF
jgi:TonB-dependent receptor